MNTFLVTGYPRSRTAWCANFLTFGPSFCFHDPVVHYRIEDFPRLFARMGIDFCGVSDSGAMLYIDEYMKLFPRSRIVLIKRSPTEVVRSMARLGFDFRAAIGTFEQAFLEIEKRYEVLTVPFGALPATEIWEHCVPGIPVHQIRLRMLNEFRVSILPEILDRNVAEGIKKFHETGRLY